MMDISRQPGGLHCMSGKNVSSLLRYWQEKSPDNTFLKWEPLAAGKPRSWSYEQFATDVWRLSSGLLKLGVKKGDCINIHLDNSPEFLLSWFSCVHLGAIPVTTNTRSSLDELSYYLSHSESVASITSGQHVDSIKNTGAELQFILVTDESSASCGSGEVSNLYEHLGAATFTPHDVSDSDICSLQYTSGTTSRPKGVMWTHANALWGGRVTSGHLKSTPQDTALVYLPLFHTNALCYSMLSTLWSGGSMVLLPKFSASRFWPVSVENKCTWTATIPAVISALQDKPDPEGSHSFRLWGGAFSNVPGVMERWGISTLGWWGMTETISQVIMTPVDIIDEDIAMGRVVPEYSVRVVDDAGVDVSPGTVGHLLVKGVPGLSLFAGYLKNDEATDESYDDGWFITGDLVKQLPSGAIAFSDRAKDMLKVGGENVSASEVERVILAVDGVLEAAVVSRPDDFLDEVPVAYVTANGNNADIEARIVRHCSEMLSDFKVPRAVRVVEELPRIMLGKVSKKKLREMASTDFAN
ncbi:AMP-binding protein [Kineobactrum salinum]|uniref:ATP-dependent acyl-CoA ligase n=1 Tax=Kineobactrum salinum TaxID=2708301 RepID=A0A6C0TZZ7_9GAMM|nr:AMP-binding protein [Kineobactrum salinum]QIB64919.1 ATP-dependent acyl-CoA ligase [Kineobactrum salinum]